MPNASEIQGKVISVNISAEKGTSKSPVQEIVLCENGIVGDAHAGPWHRQISLLAWESVERFSSVAGEHAFACGDFAENITTQHIDLLSLHLMDRIHIGEVVLEVTQFGKKCHGGGCAIYQQVGKCVMPKEGIFCRVIRGGTIHPGDELCVQSRTLHCRIITLSDRAYEGVYEDRSGPLLAEALQGFCKEKHWMLMLEELIFPDNADAIEYALSDAINEAVDVVFTTGGTGIGPRDFTPDVIMAMADKIIPGIMEHIRLSCGATHPNALLSRSVAAVLGDTLVFALPGSPKAIREYMQEIFKILEHALFMSRGMDVH